MQIDFIHALLHRLGISRRFTGYDILVELSLLILRSNNLISNHDMLETVASHHGCKLENIERNLHTAILRAWMTSPGRINALAGYPLDKAPSVSEFIDILARALLRSRIM